MSSSAPTFNIKTISDSSISNIFSKELDIFGLKIYATSGTSDQDIIHAGKIYAEYLDNDSDGTVDEALVLEKMIASNAILGMTKDQNETDSLDFSSLSNAGYQVQDLNGVETIQNSSEVNRFDATLEEVLHLITDYGYGLAYPEAFASNEFQGTFSINNSSLLTDAMDTARGGKFLTIPTSYPSSAWYTFYDDTADYSTQATEYFYWGLTSILGAQSFPGRYEEIKSEWKLNTAQKVEETDSKLYNLLTDPKYKLPTILPDGNYSIINLSINNSPTDIKLSTTNFNENIPTSSTIATLSSSDPDSYDTHSYALVNGSGDTDNNSFTIDGSSLKIKASPDYETKSSYNLRLQTTDSNGESHTKAFTLSVNNLDDSITTISGTTKNDSWAQIGAAINGEASYDQSGESVSLSADGSIIAIGARWNDGNGNTSGHVRVYKNINDTWTQIGSDIDGESTSDQSGESVVLSNDGSILAISAKFNDDNGTDSGHVRVYKNVNDTWTQIGSDIDGEALNDKSGESIALSADGSILAIGASQNDGNGTRSGHVRVYKNINDTWTQIGSDIDGESSTDQLGESVSLSADGSILAIGASQNDGNGTDSGHVRVYKNVNDTWTQIGSDIDGESAGDRSGLSVSLSGDGSVLAIGATANNENGTQSGHVRVYKNVNDT